MSTHFTVERKRRGSPIRGRNEGYGRRSLVWTCVACHRQHFDERPGLCVECDGKGFHYFQSRVEANRFAHLFLQLGQGMIRDLVVHPTYPIYGLDRAGKPVELFKYIADFGYVRVRDGVEIIEDAKPSVDPRSHDPVFKLKARAVERCYGVPITIYTTPR